MSFLPYSNLAGERCLTYIGTEGVGAGSTLSPRYRFAQHPIETRISISLPQLIPSYSELPTPGCAYGGSAFLSKSGSVFPSGGEGEGHQEILPRHQLLKLALEPLLTLVVLAVRAAAMPARMRHQDLMVAVGALGEHHGTCRGTAVLHGGQCLEMRR